MTKADLGIKRLCQNCGAKYYDLNRKPIVCPSCGTQFEAVVAKTRPQTSAKAPVKPAEEAPAVETAEIVSLEQADEEAAQSGKVKSRLKGDDDDLDVDDVDDVEDIEADDDDDTFLEEEEEDDEDVSDIIGDVDDEET